MPDPVAVLHDDPLLVSLAESTLIGHLRRRFSTCYIKAEGEVDAAYIEGHHVHPIEMKWSRQTSDMQLWLNCVVEFTHQRKNG